MPTLGLILVVDILARTRKNYFDSKCAKPALEVSDITITLALRFTIFALNLNRALLHQCIFM
jgi:hypothetical protein